MRISEDDLRGRTVITADGQAIGETAALIIDSTTWHVQALQVRLRKDIADELGTDRSMFRAGVLEIPVRMVQSVGDAVLLSAPTAELRQVSASEPAPVH